MSAELNYKGNLKIEEYEFGAFLQLFQDAILNGYVLDLETNDHYPNKYGSYMEVTLVSTNFKPVEENVVQTEEKVELTNVSEENNTEVTLDQIEEKPTEVTTRKRKNSAT